MQRFFCDLCDEECTGSPTKRWERVSGEIGLEVVVLQGSLPVNGTHICDECITKIFWDMVEKHNPNQGINKLKDVYKRKELEIQSREAAILPKEEALETIKRQLEKTKELLKAKEDELNKSNVIIEQARTFKHREAEVVRMAEARGRQAAIDEFDGQMAKRQGRF